MLRIPFGKQAQALAAALALGAALLGLAPVAAQSGPPAIPTNLHAPSLHERLTTTYATGSQIYVCTAQPDNPYSFGWTFKAPEAALLNARGEKVGDHYAGPTWEWHDGSTVTARVSERADAPTPATIPWLLLYATESQGAGMLSDVTFIQRVETVGGTTPMDICNQSTADTELAVPYSATYVFYVWRGDPS
jgi:FtsP/CotA-like multicopper oxidase with cupredoxin domain